MTAPASFLILQEPFGKEWLNRETMANDGPADIAELVDDAQPFKVIRVDLTTGTATDATRDVLAVFATRSLESRNPPARAIAEMLEGRDMPFYSRADELADENATYEYERQASAGYRARAL